jgi:hypothetical protein
MRGALAVREGEPVLADVKLPVFISLTNLPNHGSHSFQPLIIALVLDPTVDCQ